MRPLIDADILLHEIGWSSEFKDKESGEEVLLPFSIVSELLDNKVKDICIGCNATEDPVLFLTSTEFVIKTAKVLGKDVQDYAPGYRYDVAVTVPYKGTRKSRKPFHLYNITAYLLYKYNIVISVDGLEADDMLCVWQSMSTNDTVICSRDKDLRICEGWHYSWECGNQREIGPHYTDRLGRLEVTNKKPLKVLGFGQKFFYYQMLVGDSADNIPGLPKYGPVAALKILNGLSSEVALFKAVKSEYLKVKGGDAKTYFMEQANLLWMRTSLNEGFVPPI